MPASKYITVNAQLVDHMLEGARLAGVDVGRLLQESEISPLELQTLEARIPAKKIDKLALAMALLMKDESYGQFERPVPLGLFRLVLLSVVHTGTLGAALQRYVEYNNVFENSLRGELHHNGRQVTLVLNRIPDRKIVDDVAICSLLTVVLRLLGWLVGVRIVPSQVMMDYPPPIYQSEFQYLYHGAPVQFSQDCINMSFDASYLELPIVQNESTIENYIRQATLDAFMPTDSSGEVSLAVRKYIRIMLTKDVHLPSLEQAAQQVGLSPQSLRRRLKDEGSSFHKITAEARRDIATHHLGCNNLSIEVIAHKAGYAETSSFIRAFKSWTGVTPLQYRRNQGFDSSQTTSSL